MLFTFILVVDSFDFRICIEVKKSFGISNYFWLIKKCPKIMTIEMNDDLQANIQQEFKIIAEL